MFFWPNLLLNCSITYFVPNFCNCAKLITFLKITSFFKLLRTKDDHISTELANCLFNFVPNYCKVRLGSFIFEKTNHKHICVRDSITCQYSFEHFRLLASSTISINFSTVLFTNLFETNLIKLYLIINNISIFVRKCILRI